MSQADAPSDSPHPQTTFADLQLSPALLEALAGIGYETPSPIQAATIPPLLAGRDVLGQAQTGTGKTAAFALPLLQRLDLNLKAPQVLVLAPTRELAIQVAEAFQSYAAKLKGFHVLPIYGGQSYHPQLAALKRGAQVIVGTPGRVVDHMKRGTLRLDQLSALVLDEADEMLRMGFIDEVEWIMEQTPTTRQSALFSATMPSVIRRIAQKHQNNPEVITIKNKTTTNTSIQQRYWLVSGVHKMDALTRILEAETIDAMLVFARTRQATVDIAERLCARGFTAAALNGDIQQAQRERTVSQLKDGRIDILVATDVAARGLDVDRISHVLNYDIPHDTESYVHRIGRTGRAGRTGEAILFVAPKERYMLRNIERATRQPITPMSLPTIDTVNDKRISKFKQRIADTLAAGGLGMYRNLIEQYEQEHNTPATHIAAALACIMQGDTPLLLEARGKPERAAPTRPERSREPDEQPRERRKRSAGSGEPGMETYRIEVGHQHGVKPGNIVGAIASEAGLDSQYIGRIDIQDDHSLVDLPEGMPKEIFQDLRKTRVAGQQLRICIASDAPPAARSFDKPHGKPAHKKPAHKKSFKPGNGSKPAGKARSFSKKKHFD